LARIRSSRTTICSQLLSSKLNECSPCVDSSILPLWHQLENAQSHKSTLQISCAAVHQSLHSSLYASSHYVRYSGITRVIRPRRNRFEGIHTGRSEDRYRQLSYRRVDAVKVTSTKPPNLMLPSALVLSMGGAERHIDPPSVQHLPFRTLLTAARRPTAIAVEVADSGAPIGIVLKVCGKSKAAQLYLQLSPTLQVGYQCLSFLRPLQRLGLHHSVLAPSNPQEHRSHSHPVG